MLGDVRPPVDPHNCNILQQNSISLNRRNAPAREADDEEPALQREALRREIEHIAAVAHRESAFNPRAVSAVGAGGLMQLMPATARYLGATDVFDARQNVNAGAKYLRMLLDTFHGDLDLTLAAYNAGPGAVQKYNGVPPYRETQAYVRSIRSNYERALAN